MNNRVLTVSSKTIVVEKQAANGQSAYQVAVRNGFIGTEQEWLDSLKGEQGDPGGGSGNYTHTQSVPAAVWNITHNLAFYPTVTVVDSAEDEVVGDIEYIDVNSLRITFNGGFSGKAYMS